MLHLYSNIEINFVRPGIISAFFYYTQKFTKYKTVTDSRYEISVKFKIKSLSFL